MAQINKPSEYFNTKLFTGNGSTNAITGVGFQPDLVWSKSRNQVSHHLLYDSVRGVQKFIQSSTDNAEQTNANTLISFDSDGMTFGSADNGNNSSSNGVAWNWLANGAGVSNTDGSITSTVSANTTSGFSIVKWTPTYGSAQSIGHGLGTVPKVIIQKPLDGSASNWVVGGFGLDWSGYLILNLNDAFYNNSNDTSGTGRMFSAGGTDPTANVWYTDTAAITGNATSVIAYCFAEKKGFSKFGSYVGNGNVDGAFIYTGMKPAFVMIKTTGSIASNWQIFDNRRPSYNPNDNIAANNNSTEDTTSNKFIDIVSNGFKARKANVINESGEGYIYMAFAENPLVGTNNIPATAR